MQFLDRVPAIGVVVAYALLFFVASEVGRRFGTRRPGTAENEGPKIVQAAAFTLLGLLLAFSYSLSLSRYDARRATVVSEANAIGTLYLRTDLLDAKNAEAMRSDLRDYVAARLAFARNTADPQAQAVATDRSSALQRSMWQRAMAIARADPRSTTTPLFVAALNDVIDLSTTQAAVLDAHIPDVVMLLLVLIACTGAGMFGYSLGSRGERALAARAFFAVTIALTIGIVLDLDRPQRGFIRVSLAALESAQRDMQR